MTHFDGSATRSNRVRPWRLAGKCVFASLFLIAGVGHFASTESFVKIMPPYIPFHRELVLLSGVIEIALGVLLLVPKTSRMAAWGLVALLIAVFPANVYLYQHHVFLRSLIRRPSTCSGSLCSWCSSSGRSPIPGGRPSRNRGSQMIIQGFGCQRGPPTNSKGGPAGARTTLHVCCMAILTIRAT